MTSFFFNTDKYVRLERIIYTVFGIVILISPFILQLYEYVSDANILQYNWSLPLGALWRMLPFLLIFLLNDLVLLPLLFMQGHKTLYFVTIPLILIVVWCMSEPPRDMKGDGNRPPMEDRAEFDMDLRDHLPDREPREDDRHPRMGLDDDEFRQMEGHPHRRPNVFALMNEMFVLTLIFANMALKLYVQTLRNSERLEQAKMEKVSSELKALKYQVNPHFLMNTLNNIHALIDIDSDRAQEVIQQLSKMMRYMLYESDKPMVPLCKEIEFMQHFIDLMRIRYPEEVRISASFPKVAECIRIPSLLFISFIENAFKYGISYEAESDISVSIKVEQQEMSFCCMNTVNQQPTEKDSGGIGIMNVKKRLDLLYPGRYTLNMQTIDNRFIVSLSIPYDIVS